MNNKLTGYPSIDKTHLKDLKYSDLHPFIPNISISNAIDAMFLFKGSMHVFDCLGLRVRHRQFKEDADIIAKAFLSLGIVPGDIIAVSMPNLYQAVAAFKAANKIGAIITFLNPFAAEEELLGYLNKYDSPVLINYDKSIEFNKRIKSASKLRYIITLSKDRVNDREFTYNEELEDIPEFLSYHQLGAVASKWRKKVRSGFDGKQEALILYTSGSTGEPKSLLFTNENLLAALIYLKKSTHQKKAGVLEKRWMGVVPFMYPYGFLCSVLAPIFVEAELILAPDINPDNIEKYYKKRSVSDFRFACISGINKAQSSRGYEAAVSENVCLGRRFSLSFSISKRYRVL